MFCPACGTSNDSSALFCLKCGNAMPSEVSVTSKPAEPDTQEYYKAVIGPKNTARYLSKFEKFDASGKVSAGWNWPAFFIFFYWSLYRKMWKNAFIYFMSPYILSIPVGILAAMGKDSQNFSALVGAIYLVYVGAMFLIPALYGDALYYKHCKKLIGKVKASTPDYQRQLGELTGRGGTGGAVIWVFLILFFVALIGILAAIAIPAYQSYTTKAKIAQSYNTGTEVAQHVGAYYSQHHEIPHTIFEAGYTGPLPPSIKDIIVNQKNGIITITMAQQPIYGKSFSLIPSKNGETLEWLCASDDIDDNYLPSNCKHPR